MINIYMIVTAIISLILMITPFIQSAITSIVFPPSIFVTIPSLIGGVLLLKNKYENNEQDSNEDNNFFEYGFEWN